MMFVADGERRGQSSDGIGIELGLGRIAVPLGVRPRIVRNTREALRAGQSSTAREGADAGPCIIHALLSRAVGRRRRDRSPEQWTDGPREGVARPNLKLLMAIFGAGRDCQRLGETDGIILGHVEVDDVLGVTQAAGVEVIWASLAERRIERIMHRIIELAPTASGRQVGVPSA